MLTDRLTAIFWARVAKSGKSGGCWEWLGAGRHEFGYGRLGKPRQYAHRYSYELHHGPTPAGMFVLHKCDNPPCVNPAHLYAGTQKRNCLDAVERGRANRVRGADHPRVKHPELNPLGEDCALSKLKTRTVLAIRRAKARGTLHKTICRRFGTSMGNVSAIVNRVTWRHI